VTDSKKRFILAGRNIMNFGTMLGFIIAATALAVVMISTPAPAAGFFF
jgi:hypothetical protein